MPRDYANHRRQRVAQSHRGSSGIVWLLFGILIGLIIAGIFYLKNQHAHPALPSPAVPTKTMKSSQNTPSLKPTAPQNLQTQFDFYNVLPSQKAIGPSGDEDMTAATPQPLTTPTTPVIQAPPSPASPLPPPSKPVNKPISYIIQILVLPSALDPLKAQLILSGFEIKISDTTQNGKPMKRILLGPYTTLDEAKDMQKQLQANQMTGQILKTG